MQQDSVRKKNIEKLAELQDTYFSINTTREGSVLQEVKIFIFITLSKSSQNWNNFIYKYCVCMFYILVMWEAFQI